MAYCNFCFQKAFDNSYMRNNRPNVLEETSCICLLNQLYWTGAPLAINDCHVRQQGELDGLDSLPSMACFMDDTWSIHLTSV
eukprot:jgi/Mesvir1/13436/Mv25628-RA.1